YMGLFMRIARYIFLIAGIYGLLVMTPHYFLEHKISTEHPPAITHPEFFYGFIGLAVVFQIVFLSIAIDPVKYRLMMIQAVLEKVSFGLPAMVLHATGRLDGGFFFGGVIDLVLGSFFVIAYVLTSRSMRLRESRPRSRGSDLHRKLVQVFDSLV